MEQLDVMDLDDDDYLPPRKRRDRGYLRRPDIVDLDIEGESTTITTHDIDIESRRAKIKECKRVLKLLGFKSSLELLLEEIAVEEASRNSKQGRHSIDHEQLSRVLEHISNLRSYNLSSRLATAVISLAIRVYENEFQELKDSKILRQPIKNYSANQLETHSFGVYWDEFEAKVLHLLRTLKSVVQNNQPPENGGQLSQHLEGYIDDDEALESVAIESIACIPSSDLNLVSTESHLSIPDIRRDKRVIIISALSSLCYAHSNRLNGLAGQIGYYLTATRTPKRTIETLHKLGLSLSYESLQELMRIVASNQLRELKAWAKESPALFVFADNMNFFLRSKQTRLDNPSVLMNYTAAYVGLNGGSRIRKAMVKKDAYHESRINSLTCEAVTPRDLDRREQLEAFLFGIYNTLKTYCLPHLKTNHLKDKVLPPSNYNKIHQIPAKPAKMFVLPTFDKDETKIRDVTDMLRHIFGTYLGMSHEMLQKKLWAFMGDLLTIRNVR
jgi:hypothetical protein